MTTGSFTRQMLETRISDRLNTILGALHDLAILNERVAAEFSAGTLDATGFYEGDDQDKANLLGTLDQASHVYAWLMGKGDVTPPSGDPLAYATFFIGL